jgi:acyl-CoA thioesterase-2
MSTHEDEISTRRNQRILGFLSDETLMFNAAVPHGVPFQTHLLKSLDHSVWFHRTCDVRKWMLFDQRNIAATDGRGMNEGKAYDQDGQLIFAVAQESMLKRL